MNADKPLGLGLIGCGAFGLFCLEIFSKLPALRIAAVADVRKDAADALAARFNVPAFYEPAGLIAAGAVDLVHIATPPASHYELAMAALQAHKHVFCEKPLAISTTHADEMLSAARKAGRILPVNFVLQHNQVTDIAKAVIESGALGRVLSGRLTNCAADTNLPEDHWFWDKTISGGIFIEHGGHFFDLYRYWLGPGQVISAHAETREGAGQEDRVTCTVRHENGAVVSHYHGFDQVGLMDRADHRLICELGDIRVQGWIPVSLTIDAAVDDNSAAKLAQCCPGATVEVVEAFDAERGETTGRATPRRIKRRIRLSCTPNSDKQAVYSASVRDLLADQVAYIHDPQHRRRIDESNGRQALALAQAAAQLAAK